MSTSFDTRPSAERATTSETALEIIDAATLDRVLIYGSLPPGGRDLDLLAYRADRDAIRGALIEAGFIAHGSLLARFQPERTDVVDIIAADSWSLPPDELAALFRAARPIAGAQRVVRPAPEHALLILARRLMRKRTLPDKLRARVDEVLAEAPDAWRSASELAPRWGVVQALRALETAYRGDGNIPARSRWRILSERIGRPGTRPLRTQVRMLRSLLPRPHRTHIVTLSGLDGAGKSSGGKRVQAVLEMAGCDVVVIWRGLGAQGALDRIKKPVKRLMRMLPRVGPWKEVVGRLDSEKSTGQTPFADPGKAKRRRGLGVTIVMYAWATVIAGINVWALRRAALPYFGRGCIIIYDRYTLDSAVRLKHFYGDSRVTRLLVRLMSYANKRPIRAYLLDVSPQISFDRKGEWDLEDLAARSALYHAEYQSLNVRLLDATRPAAELSAEIATDIWRALKE